MRYADLDETVWTRFSSGAIADLANAVTSELTRNGWRTESVDLIPDGPLKLSDLHLSSRSINTLRRSGLVRDGVLRPVVARQLLTKLALMPNVGSLTLLDILTALEVADTPSDRSEPPARDEVPAAQEPGLSPSRAVRRAVRPLLSRRWSRKVTSRDPRLGSSLLDLDPRAATARDAADLLANKPFDPRGARRKAQQVRAFIERVDQLRSLTLEEELDEIVVALTPKPANQEVVKARLGLAGQPPVTLDEAGKLANVTRERARQLSKQVIDAIQDRGAWTPVLDKAVRVVADAVPATAGAIEQHLREEGLVEHEFSPGSLLRAAELFGRQLPVSYDSEAAALFRHGQATGQRIAHVARSLVTHWGATTVADVEAAVAEQRATADANTTALVLSTIPGFCWLDEDRGWFWIKGTARNRLLNQVEKIMAIAGSIDLGELRAGVGRHHRMSGFRPPREVLGRLLEQTDLYRREGNRIVGLDLPDWREILGHNERTLAEILFEYGPVMRKGDLEELAVVQRGLSRGSFGVYLTYSPILARYAPGVWGLRGAEVTAAAIDAMIPPLVRNRVLQDHGWTEDRQIWVAYKLSKGAVASGVLGPPAALRSVTRGQFALFDPRGRPVGTLVIGEQGMWGFAPFFNRGEAEPGDYLVVVFDLEERRAALDLGGEEILLRHQRGE